MPYPVAAARPRLSGRASAPAPLTYGQKVALDGASFYLPISENVGSPTVTDAIGGLVGTVSGGVTLGVAGPLSGEAVNRAALFDGAGGTGALTVTHAAAIDVGAGDWTFETWFYLTSAAVVAQCITKQANSDPHVYPGYQCFVADRTLGFYVANSDVDTDGLAGGANSQCSLNAWHHGVWTFARSGNALLYLDGELDGTVSLVDAGVDGSWGNVLDAILGLSFPGSDSLPGTLARPAIYPLVLSPAQIAAHAAYGGL